MQHNDCLWRMACWQKQRPRIYYTEAQKAPEQSLRLGSEYK